MNLLSLTAVELGKKIKAHEVTVEEATRAALDAIRAKEKDINSFVTVDEESAMIRAKEVQKMIDDGTLTGPLAGVPVAIKDNMCTKGMLTTCSSKILYNFIPTYTAEAVINLEKAGAVILGKTNMDEFAMGSTTETSAYGETKNPWNTAHVPGGSSGGSCAAVAASAVKVGIKRRNANPNHTGEEEYNYFLSVLFPHDQLKILPYNRVVHDLNGYTADAFIDAVKADFEVEAVTEAYQPEEKAAFGMYLDGIWYKLRAKSHILSEDPVDGLDVSILQDHLLAPILGIENPRTDKRIDFIGGIRGLAELERRANSDMKLAFSMYPTSIEELFAVADAKRLMPPKSTWFEPKLRSGIFIHKL